MSKLINFYLNENLDSFFENFLRGQSSHRDMKTLHDSLLSDTEFRELFADWIKSLRDIPGSSK
ncbi:hypothetical protein GW915_13465 [bacterium]|nr:hypothetical protein [bacterium]